MSAEHVFAEDAAVSLEPDTLGIEHQLRPATEIAHHIASGIADLFEEEAPIDVWTDNHREVFNRLADEPLVDDRADHAL
jgi:hypothetical protein